MKTRYFFIIVLLAVMFNSTVAHSKEHLSSLRGKKVLFVYGGWKNHFPEEYRDLLVPWLKEQGAEVTISDNLDIYADSAVMASADLIIQTISMATITKEQEQGLLKCIRNGCGIAGWHGGLADSFRQNVGYQFMVGGQWVAHPGGMIDFNVNIKNHEDPITSGLKDFSMHSEQYYMHVDPNIEVLATTTFSGDYSPWLKGVIMPVVWKKFYGKGRVFYSSLGHNTDDMKIPEAYEILKRGIIWASESKYQK